MSFIKLGTIAISLVALTLAGCQSQRFAAIDTPRPSPSTVAQPLPPAPAGTVTSGQLSPPTVEGAQTLQGGTAFPEAPQQQPGMDNQQQMASAAGATNVTAGSVAGVWNASVAGQSCRIATPQTRFGSGFRAGPLRCPAPLDNVRSWNVEGSQLALYDGDGGVLARLYSSGGTRFDGQTTSGQPLSLSR